MSLIGIYKNKTPHCKRHLAIFFHPTDTIGELTRLTSVYLQHIWPELIIQEYHGLNNLLEKMTHVKYWLELAYNVVLFDNNYGLIHMTVGTADKFGSDIVAMVESIPKLKSGLDKKICTNFMYIPYSASSLNYISTIIGYATTNNITDSRLNDLPSVISFVTNTPVVDYTNILKKSILTNNSAIYKNEIIKLAQETYPIQPFAFDQISLGSFIYYPFYDLNILPTKSVHNIEPTDTFNTSNAVYESTNYDIIYKRFNNSMQGLFVPLKLKSQYKIPPILHIVFDVGDTVDTVDETYIQQKLNQWSQYLRMPWSVKSWTTDDIDQLMSQSANYKTYKSIKCSILRNLLVKFTILELMGGVIIDHKYMATKPIPEYILYYDLTLMLDTINNKINYDIISAMPGELKKEPMQYDAATKPFMGANNFFIEIAMSNKTTSLTNKTTKSIDNTIYRNPKFYQQIFSIINTESNLTKLAKIMMSTPDLLLIPDYFMQSVDYDLPKTIKKRIFAKISNIDVLPVININNQPTRTYNATIQSIWSYMHQNPQTRLAKK